MRWTYLEIERVKSVEGTVCDHPCTCSARDKVLWQVKLGS